MSGLQAAEFPQHVSTPTTLRRGSLLEDAPITTLVPMKLVRLGPSHAPANTPTPTNINTAADFCNSSTQPCVLHAHGGNARIGGSVIVAVVR